MLDGWVLVSPSEDMNNLQVTKASLTVFHVQLRDVASVPRHEECGECMRHKTLAWCPTHISNPCLAVSLVGSQARRLAVRV